MKQQLTKSQFISAIARNVEDRQNNAGLSSCDKEALRCAKAAYAALLLTRGLTGHNPDNDWSEDAAKKVFDEVLSFAPGEEVTIFLEPKNMDRFVHGIVLEPHFGGFTTVYFHAKHAAQYCRLKGIEYDCGSRAFKVKTNKIMYRQGDELLDYN